MKHIDENGFWVYEANPISRVGVFPYLGRQIDRDGSLGLVPDKVYKVFRSPEFLFSEDAMKSFDGKPFIDEHEMLGRGFTSVDDRPVDGAIYNVRPSSDQPGVLLADFTIYTDSFKRKLESGKREISLGYYCDYVQEPGEYRGEKYDFKQTNMRGNHVALVNRGRMGSGVRVCDHALTFDSIEGIPEMRNETEQANVAEALANCLKGADDERCKRLLDFLEKDLAENGGGAGTGKGAEAETIVAAAETGDGTPPPPPPATEKKPDDGEDKPDGGGFLLKPAPEKPEDGGEGGEAAPSPADGEGKPDGENAPEPAPVQPPADAPAPKDGDDDEGDDEDEDGEGKPDGEEAEDKACKDKACKGGKGKVAKAAKAEDCNGKPKPEAKPFSEDELRREIRADYARAQALADAVAPYTGAFEHSEMSERDVAAYACDKLDIDCADGEALPAIRGFLVGVGKRPHASFTIDSSGSPKAEASTTDSCLKQYLG